MLWLLWACVGGPESYRLVDTGSACLTDDVLSANEPLEVRVGFDECASACATVLSATCTAAYDQGVVEVRGVASVLPPPEGDCIDVCSPIEATCTVTLEAGEALLSYGGATAPFSLPSTPPEPICATASEG